MPFSGHLSDRFGRKRIYLIGAVGIGVFGFVYFALLNTMVPGWMFLAIWNVCVSTMSRGCGHEVSPTWLSFSRLHSSSSAVCPPAG
jgi:MFS family permease